MSNELKKSIGFLGLVTLGAAGVIGSSWIYTTSSFFTKYGAGGVVFGMLLACCLAACIALAYAELASQFPRAGGEIVYTYIAWNPALAFVVGWMLIGALLSNTAFYMSALGGLISLGIPSLQAVMESIPIYSVAGTEVYLWGLLAGILLVFFFFFLNVHSVDVGAGSQKILFTIKLILGCSLVVAGISLGKWTNFWPAFNSLTPEGKPATFISDAVLVMRFVIPALTFLTGFTIVSQLAEEANLSRKNIGKTIVVTIFLAGGYYCLVLLGTAMIIPWQLSSTMPLGAVSTFTHAGYPLLGYFALAIAFLGMATGSLGMAMGCSRVIFAMGRSGLLPACLGRANQRGVPANALVLTLILTLSFGWLGRGAMLWLLDMGGVFVGICWALTVFCMYRIRRLYPDNPRPYKVSVSWLPLLGALGALAIIVMTLIPGSYMSLVEPEYIILAMWLMLGLVFYFFYVRKNSLQSDKVLKIMLAEDYVRIRQMKQRQNQDNKQQK